MEKPVHYIKLKRTLTSTADVVFNLKLCIICQLETSEKLHSTENGCKRIRQAAEIRRDYVHKRLQNTEGTSFAYHMNNKCYKNYTHKVKLERLSTSKRRKLETKDWFNESDRNKTVRETSTIKSKVKTRSNILGKSLRINKEPNSCKLCVICGKYKCSGERETFRICEVGRASKFLSATKFYKDDVYTRTADLTDVNSVFATNLYYHSSCMSKYLVRYDRELSENIEINSSKDNKIKEICTEVFQEIKPQLKSGIAYVLSDVTNVINAKLGEAKVQNRTVKSKLEETFGDEISFTSPIESNKSQLIFDTSLSTADVAEQLRSTNVITDCAAILRQSFKEVDFDLANRFCDAQDLESSWKNIHIPEPILSFFSELLDIPLNKLKPPAPSPNQDEACEDKVSHLKYLKICSLFQIIYYIMHNGKKRTPLHVMNGVAIHAACKSSAIIKSLNHIGVSISYDEVLRYRSDLASFIVDENNSNVPLPSHFSSDMFTTAGLDNFDHDEAVLSGVGGSHDTVMVLFQDKPQVPLRKPLVHDTTVKHGQKLPHELDCQKLKDFKKPSVKLELPSNYKVVEKSLTMDATEYKAIQLKEFAWYLCRMNPAKFVEINLTPSQTIPVWSAFNAATADTLYKRIHHVGFLPMIPHPVTQYDTVYTSLKNLQNVLTQLKQNKLPVTCDEGVYRIAREIMFLRPAEFDNILLMLGSFHMRKIFLGCIGNYLKDGGAESIFIESHIFGPNVVESVLKGSNYVRSLKGILLLDEAMKRLQITEFFNHAKQDEYLSELNILEKLQRSVEDKDFERSKIFVKEFIGNGEKLHSDFQTFVTTQRENSETSKYWDNFLIMVSTLKDFIRADRERNWKLYVQTLEHFMNIFSAFDRTNYIRWGSVFVEDMKGLAERAPEVHDEFVNKGNFVVQRSNVAFTAVGGDLCLEQTINKSQKSAAGVIGVTRRKSFVTEWELIFHEILLVYNLYSDITRVSSTDSYELRSNHHDLTKPITIKSEGMVNSMIKFILRHENPFDPSNAPLHNIITKVVVPDHSRSAILNVIDIGKEAYDTLRCDRFVKKTTLLSDVIHRLKLPPFKPQKVCSSNQKSVSKNKDKAKVQHVINLAQERGPSTKELLTYDIVTPKMLYDENGCMTKAQKSTLCDELETTLEPDDPKFITKTLLIPCSYVVDVMGYARRIMTKNMNTFGDFANGFIHLLHQITGKDIVRIDFVFDSYIDMSPKSNERSRRASDGSIEIQAIDLNTPLPVKLESFWASSKNKTKLQEFLKEFIFENGEKYWPAVTIFCSATTGEKIVTCKSKTSDRRIEEHQELSFSNLEEADLRIVPHIMHATKEGIKQVVVLSSDTDVVVLALHFMNRFSSEGLQELWMRLGSARTSRYVPVHIIASRLGNDLCSVLPALHILTGCDYTSKFGTKRAALKCNSSTLLMDFGKVGEGGIEGSVKKGEKYLVHVLKKYTQCETMNDLRHWMYCHCKTKTLEELPPTSRATRQHILRAFYCTYVQIHCLEEHVFQLDPLLFGYSDGGYSLVPKLDFQLFPSNLLEGCNCKTCAKQSCTCVRAGIPCCSFCKCRSVTVVDCRNAHK